MAPPSADALTETETGSPAFPLLTETEAPPTISELLASPAWYLAETLPERLACWRAASSPRPPVDDVLAARRLERWKGQDPFHRQDLWQARLESVGLSEDELLYLLGESAEQVKAHSTPPAWLEDLAQAYGSEGLTPFYPWPAETQLDRCRFLPFLEPLVFLYAGRLERAAAALCADYPEAPFVPEIARQLTAHLPDLFAHRLNRTLLVELHVLKLDDSLEGETPEERFENFLLRLRDRRYALEIFEHFPVLARQTIIRFDQWHDACADLLRHLAEDSAAISERFFAGARLGRLVAVGGSMSDSHRDGRAVLLLEFEGNQQLVYKPKTMRLEERFQDLLGWLNGIGWTPAFRQVGVLDRGDHGYMEMIVGRPCFEEAEFERFLERQGGYLALLYVLDATDFHHENLLADGEHPILVDLETLFQPWLNGKKLHDIDAEAGAPLRSTVLRPNMLPERFWGDKENAGVDLSGITAPSGQLTPQKMLAATDAGRDTMRMERRRIEIPVGDHQVRLVGREVTVAEFASGVERGFRRLYELMANRRSELKLQFDLLADCEIRILFRNTASYGALLLESFHPHALGNALERQRLFDKLWVATVRRPFLIPLASSEQHDLWRSDIPLFLSRPSSRDAWDWNGEIYPHTFEESGLDRVRRKVEALSVHDLERQVAVIRDSFDAVRLASRAVPRPKYEFVARSTRPSADELLALACAAADRVLERTFENEHEALWLTLDYRAPNGWQLAHAGPDFYLGLPGIAFFLGYLGAATGNRRYTEVAKKALVAQKQQIAADATLVKGLGGFNGWGGIIYALTHMGRLWQDESLLDEAESYTRRLPELVENDILLDVIMGSAGLLYCLDVLAEARPSAFLDRLMVQCGDRLLARIEPQSRGLGWRMPLAANRALAGLSHGAAGIAVALLKLAARTGNDAYRAAALGGIDFERHLFTPEEQNWPDLRVDGPEDDDAAIAAAQANQHQSHGHEGHGHEGHGHEGHGHEGHQHDDGESRFMLAWCHGAPGIGLARLAGLPYLDDEAVRQEIAVAVKTTISRGFGDNHCLCHGDLGNLELVASAARFLGDAELEEQAWRMAGGIADSIKREGWLFGLPGNIETPGLMAGLAGIGYALARLVRPDLLPDVLTLSGFQAGSASKN